MTNLIVTKLAKFFDREIQDAKKILIVSDKGIYELFGRFRIEPAIGGCFTVHDSLTREKVEFSNLKYATGWCLLVDGNKFKESRRLLALDLKLCSLNVDMQIHKRILKITEDVDTKLLYTIKLQEDSYKRKSVIREIDSYINSSKTLQVKKFTPQKEQKIKYL